MSKDLALMASKRDIVSLNDRITVLLREKDFEMKELKFSYSTKINSLESEIIEADR